MYILQEFIFDRDARRDDIPLKYCMVLLLYNNSNVKTRPGFIPGVHYFELGISIEEGEGGFAPFLKQYRIISFVLLHFSLCFV